MKLKEAESSNLTLLIPWKSRLLIITVIGAQLKNLVTVILFRPLRKSTIIFLAIGIYQYTNAEIDSGQFRGTSEASISSQP